MHVESDGSSEQRVEGSTGCAVGLVAIATASDMAAADVSNNLSLEALQRPRTACPLIYM